MILKVTSNRYGRLS